MSCHVRRAVVHNRRLKPWRWCGKRKAEDARVFWALKGPWFRIPRGQLFCLLGPNGAGKTTTINCLTGVLPASGAHLVASPAAKPC
jgi:ABC-type multidrug transport system ATPase subunit